MPNCNESTSIAELFLPDLLLWIQIYLQKKETYRIYEAKKKNLTNKE